MDTKLSILKSKLKDIRLELSEISDKINQLYSQLDITMRFEDISELLTKNRRSSSRAKQYAAEIAQITRSEQSSDINYSEIKNNLMYRSEFVDVNIPAIINSDRTILNISATFKNAGISHKWGNGLSVKLECLNDSSLNQTFTYTGKEIGYGEELIASFDYSSPIDLPGKEKILLNFIITEDSINMGEYKYTIEVRR